MPRGDAAPGRARTDGRWRAAFAAGAAVWSILRPSSVPLPSLSRPSRVPLASLSRPSRVPLASLSRPSSVPPPSLLRPSSVPPSLLRPSSVAAGAAVFVAVFALFSTTIRFPFLNWDDQDVFARNTALHSPGLIGWAFTTTYIEHYQPVAWLTWGAVDRVWALTPAAAHGLNVGLHAACALLVFLLARSVSEKREHAPSRPASPAKTPAIRSMIARVARLLGDRSALLGRAPSRICGSVAWSAAAALLFAAHPLRVEVVAWASAMPYSLALLFALLATLTFMAARGRSLGLGLSLALFATSLLARPVALGLPAVLFAIDDAPRRFRRVMPFAVLAAAAAYLEGKARLTASLSDVGVGARLTLASTAPFRYLWRTIAPANLTPLDPLALSPRADVPLMIAGVAAFTAISWMAWRWRHEHPGSAVAWLTYVALLIPAMGLVPSGLQATADRYAYLPAVPLSIWIAGAGAGMIGARRPVLQGFLKVAVAGVVASIALLAYQQTRDWRDSVALWTRAVEIDPRNDVALYNLASALAESGRRDEALARYDEVLRIIPDHRDARTNGDLLRAAALEDEGNRLAASGKLEDAIERYRRSTEYDPARIHAQAALGMALVQTGRASEALPHLRNAVARGAAEPAIHNALAFSLMQAGRTREACGVLEAARARFPGDRDVARNLAQLGDDCR